MKNKENKFESVDLTKEDAMEDGGFVHNCTGCGGGCDIDFGKDISLWDVANIEAGTDIPGPGESGVDMPTALNETGKKILSQNLAEAAMDVDLPKGV
ncbi:MAG: hypothetical protein FWD86_02785, partial [Firmicutes bacterium]|nr:hypothetical protein [Bacillota bacterium]